MRFRLHAVCLIGLVAAPTDTALAQTISASWQLQPYCNRIALTLGPSPAGGFSLNGVDDQCGAVDAGSAVGQAAFNRNGNVTLNFTIVTAPAARPVHVSAVVSPADGNGTWTDSVGNSGTFAFFGAVAGLPSRPLPASALPPGAIGPVELRPAAVGASHLAGNAVTGAAVLDGSLTSADLADAPRAAIASAIATGLSTTPRVVATVTLTAPAAGLVVVNATTYANIVHTANVATFGGCSLARGTTLEADSISNFGSNPSGVTTQSYVPIALMRSLAVGRGAVSVSLVCAGIGNLSIGASNMTAMYFPG